MAGEKGNSSQRVLIVLPIVADGTNRCTSGTITTRDHQLRSALRVQEIVSVGAALVENLGHQAFLATFCDTLVVIIVPALVAILAQHGTGYKMFYLRENTPLEHSRFHSPDTQYKLGPFHRSVHLSSDSLRLTRSLYCSGVKVLMVGDPTLPKKGGAKTCDSTRSVAIQT